MTDALQRLMRDATRLTQAGRLTEATQALQRGLGHAWPATLDGGLANPLSQALRQTFGAAAASAAAAGSSATDSTVIDGCVTELPTAPAGPAPASPASTSPSSTSPPAAQQRPAPPGSAPARPNGLGLFSSGSHHHGGLTRAYKLYSPPQAQPPGSGPALPLLVMLHGCTQDPDDFAAGTGMNALARELGFWVLYPAQSADANPQRCWNWFKHNHQQRGRGEAGLIASLTQTLVAQHGMDPGRVWIAGLSAGGAMAATVAAAYPELYAAVGVHSGLAAGAATDLPQALAAMRGGAAGALPAGAVPTIVFHGDQDGTVHPRNGEQVLAAASAQAPQVSAGRSAGGRRYTRSTCAGGAGGPAGIRQTAAEHWLVHGAGHAWSGGQPAGSFTDASGPDASREMLRFFLAQPVKPPR